MCPVTTAVVGTLISGAIAAKGQYDQASASNEAAGDQAQVQADEFAASRDEQISDRVRAARRERATLRVSAGESGVAGASVDALQKDSFGRQNQDIAIMQKQGGFTERALGTEMKSVAARNHFSGWQAGLQIASNTAGAYGSAKANAKANATT